jgi:hypothetical protein
MVTAMAVVSEHPAPLVRAGPLTPVLLGLLTKDPARRSTAEQVGRELASVAAGEEPSSVRVSGPAPG